MGRMSRSQSRHRSTSVKRLQEESKKKSERTGRSHSRRKREEYSDSSDYSSDSVSESDVDSDASDTSMTDSDYEVRRRTKSKSHKSHSRSKSKSKKGKKKRKSSKRRNGGSAATLVVVGGLLLVVVALLGSLAGVVSVEDPDDVLTFALPTPTEWTSIPSNEWKPPVKRHVVGDFRAPNLFGLMQGKLGVVQPKIDTAMHVFEDLVISGSPQVSPDGSAMCFVGKRSDGHHYVLACMDTETAKVRWITDISRDLAENEGPENIKTRRPLILAETVVFPRSCSTIDAFRLADGSPIWSTPFPSQVRTCHAVDIVLDPFRGTIVVATADGYMLGVNPTDGSSRAQMRSLSCNSPHTSESNIACIESFVSTNAAAGSFFFKGRASKALLAQAAGRSAAGSWFGRSAGADTSPVTDGIALYHVKLVPADADTTEPFMFRVEMAKAMTQLDAARGQLGQIRDDVSAAPDGSAVVAADGCVLRGFSTPLLSQAWALDFTSQEGTGCKLQSVVVTEDGDAFVTSERALYKLTMKAGSASSPSQTWRISFDALYSRLYAGEEVRVLSSPLVMENGVLLRVGTSRGRARLVVQAGIVLVDREKGSFRSFYPKNQVSMSDLAVDSFGSVYSGYDDLALRTRAGISDPAAYQSGPGGIQILSSLSTSEGLNEIAKALAARAQNCKSSSTVGWFGRVSGIDEASAMNDIAHIRLMAMQSFGLSRRARADRSIQHLRSVFDNMLHDQAVDTLRNNLKHVCEAVHTAAEAI